MTARPQVVVHIEDRALAKRVERTIADALGRARQTTAAALAGTSDLPVVHLRTQRRLEALGPPAIAGALVVVRVTEKGARRLLGLVTALRTIGAAGVELVWDGETPPRERVEAHVFAVLEAARATPKGPPVVLSLGKPSTSATLAAQASRVSSALRVLVAKRLVAKRKERSA